MAPIKFENDFKEKLSKRTIAPSKGAWGKLSNRLDAEEEKSSNKTYWWIGIAASFIGLLLVFTQFSSDNSATVEPTIVNTNTIEETPVSKSNSTIKTKALEIVEETSVVLEERNVNKESEIKDNPIVHQKVVVKPNNNYTPTQLASEHSAPKIKEDKDVLQLKNNVELSFETEKVQEVADAIFVLSETEQGVSNASIDSLLKAAQREILLSRMQNENQVAIDAALLLQEVENELDESFREKVFKALKDSYGSVKTAIAQRNE